MAKITLLDGTIIEGTIEELRQMGAKFPVEEESKEEPLKVGDYAKVLGSTHTNYFGGKDGDIVKVVKELEDRFKTEELDGGNFNGFPFALKTALIRATEEEVAEAKLEAKWAKINRKPNEYKKGDIVLTVDGDLDIVKGVAEPGYLDASKGITCEKVGWEYADETTLVTPVEARFDRDSVQ